LASKAVPVAWTRNRGRNGFDAVLDIPPDMCREALNVHFFDGGLGTKRNGASAQAIGGDSYSGHNSLFRFVPGQDETAAELFIVDNTAANKILRVAAGTSASQLSLANSIDANDFEITAATLNGKLYLAFNSDENRLHVYDPGLSTTTIRRGGLKQPAAPALATNGGSGLTITRYVKAAFTEQRNSVTVRRSELSAAASITITDDSGFTITKPTAIGEGETHWETYIADNADGPFYLDATSTTATASYSYDDATLDTSTDVAPVAGTYTPFPSVKYIISTGSRLIGYGVYETAAGDSLAPKSGRVYIGPVLDSTETHDDERIYNTVLIQGWIDISRNAGSIDRGLGLLQNVVYVFQSKGIYALVPTENAEVPYRRIAMSSQLGAVSHQSIVAAEDKEGRPCLYFLDPELGPCRIGPNGFQWCGKDVKDLWDTVNLAATNVVAHGVYHKAKGQVIWWISTAAGNDPDRCLVLDVNEATSNGDEVRYGWSTYTGTYAAARCSVMFSNTMGATMSRDLKPYVGLASGTTLLKGDDASDADDNGTDFQAYVESGAFGADDSHLDKQVLKSWVIAEALSVTLQQAFIRMSGDETNRTDTVSLAAAGSETVVRRKFEAAELQDAPWFQVRLGDASAQEGCWILLRWGAMVKAGEEI
jgi:hypothetical protein